MLAPRSGLHRSPASTNLFNMWGNTAKLDIPTIVVWDPIETDMMIQKYSEGLKDSNKRDLPDLSDDANSHKCCSFGRRGLANLIEILEQASLEATKDVKRAEKTAKRAHDSGEIITETLEQQHIQQAVTDALSSLKTEKSRQIEEMQGRHGHHQWAHTEEQEKRDIGYLIHMIDMERQWKKSWESDDEHEGVRAWLKRKGHVFRHKESPL